LLAAGDVDFGCSLIRFRRAKGHKGLEVALHAETRLALRIYLEQGRPALVAGSSMTSAGSPPTWAHGPAVRLAPCRGGGPRPLSANAVSLMLTRCYHARGGTLRTFWVAPHSLCHRHPARQPRDVARRGQPVPGPQLDFVALLAEDKPALRRPVSPIPPSIAVPAPSMIVSSAPP
jgi:hypothetical protein